jgi:hypothetical protein
MRNLNFPLKTREITPLEKDQLVILLLACQPMKERSSRYQLVDELTFADSIPKGLNITDKQDMINIVNRCLYFNDGLQQLAQRIAYHEVDSRGQYTQAIQNLSEFLDTLFAPPVFKEKTPQISKNDFDETTPNPINHHLTMAKSSKKRVYIEDANTQILERFDNVLGTGCFLGGNDVFIRGEGRDNKEPFFAKQILGKDVQIHFVIDGDGMNEHWREIIAGYAFKHGVILHQLTRHDIESYLLNPKLFERTLQEVYPSKKIPSLQAIETKMLQIMKDTISLSKYGFDRKIEGHIYKSAMLVGRDEYRNPQKSVSEALKIRETYEKFSTFDQFIEVAIGKKALKAVLDWLCSEEKLNISQNDLLQHVKPDDIPDEIKKILEQIMF